MDNKVNVQDILSYKTKIKKFKSYIKDNHPEDILSISTELNPDKEQKIKNKLNPYYTYIKAIHPENISTILYERFDNFIGFSFILYNIEYFILYDTNDKNTYFLNFDKELMKIENIKELQYILNFY